MEVNEKRKLFERGNNFGKRQEKISGNKFINLHFSQNKLYKTKQTLLNTEMKYLNYMIKGLKPKNLYYISYTSIKDTLKKHYPAYSNEVHIKAAMDWLSLAQKQNNDGGVSALFSLFEGWAPSYVETTGYIMPT